ncbi:MAG: AAA family ATPase [Chlorobi bacterium]|nr:AAA family ATPase [Chlorobiota bacterium]
MTLTKKRPSKELKPEELKWSCDLTCFDFSSTETISPVDGIVGQERAMKALKIGVDLRGPGYNVFITGLSGTGKLTSVKQLLQNILPDCSELTDYAYVNNFDDEDRPILLTFPKGKSKKFKEDLSAAIRFLQENIPSILESESFIGKRNRLIARLKKDVEAKSLDFQKRISKDGFTIGEMKIGEMVGPELLFVKDKQAYHVNAIPELIGAGKISEAEGKKIKKKHAEYNKEFSKVLKASIKTSKEIQQKVGELEVRTIKGIIEIEINDLKEKYPDPKIRAFLDQVAKDIPENKEVFKGVKPVVEETGQGYVIDYLKNYDVNIILDNSNADSCPVVIETSPTYSNLFGTIEKYSDGMGGWHADFTRIKAGSLLRANGGYLVLNALDAFEEAGVWKNLKRVLLHRKLEIQDSANLYHFSPSILQPEAINIDIKVIMIGNNYIYSLLSSYQDDFNKIFKIKAEFDYEMKRTDSALVEYARIVKKLVESEGLLEFNIAAIGKIVEYGARYAESQNKLTTRFAYIADLVREANFWAKDVNRKIVEDFHVIQAYESMRERHSLGDSKISDMINEGILLIDTKGSRVGQVNGLAVYGSGMHSYGKPTRITASVGLGNGNIINVEREAGLSGNTHNKGVLIIGGYFRETFGRKRPLSFSAGLVFEQGYGMIDGDSATAAEICALISSISRTPIKQNFAITGSVNQKGDIQPIGGINEKIEGFFKVCKARGLTGKEGVIMPVQNKNDLMLSDEVVKAVDEKKFHIYTVSRIEEAVELLMGYKAGKLLKSGRYEANTVFCEVEKRLREMKMRATPPKKNDATADNKKTTKRKK